MARDRFEQMVLDHCELGDGHRRVIWDKVIVSLLRRQHRAMVRLVTRTERDCLRVIKIVGREDQHAQGMLDGVQAIHTALARWKHGRTNGTRN